MDKQYIICQKKIILKNVKGYLHLHADSLEKKTFGDTCNQEMVSSSPIRSGLAKMAEKYK